MNQYFRKYKISSMGVQHHFTFAWTPSFSTERLTYMFPGTSRTGASGSSSAGGAKDDLISGVHGQSIAKPRPTRSRSFGFLSKEAERRDKGGSLKLFKVKDKKIRYEAVGGGEHSSCASSSQSNPSNNVILASSNSTIDASAAASCEADERRLLLSSTQESTNLNLESNRNRSRSLE